MILLKRFFGSTRYSKAHFYAVKVTEKEASMPISYPSNVSIAVHRIPVQLLPPKCPHGRFSYSEIKNHADGLRKIRESSVYYHQLQQETAIVEVRGPLGVGYVPIPEWIDLSVSLNDPQSKQIDIWHTFDASDGHLDQNPSIFKDECAISELAGCSTSDSERYLHVHCVDKESALQKRHWGFYKRRISDYVIGVTEGYNLPVRLVGVGYRAQMEAMKIKGKEKQDPLLFENWLHVNNKIVNRSFYREYISKCFPNSLWASIVHQRQLLQPDINLNFRQFEERVEKIPLPPFPRKLVVKLGYTHNVEMMIPPYIDVQIPNPSRINLRSPHKRQMHEFAYNLRKWRPPEPYKGKGVFVGDETIILKTKKVK